MHVSCSPTHSANPGPLYHQPSFFPLRLLVSCAIAASPHPCDCMFLRIATRTCRGSSLLVSRHIGLDDRRPHFPLPAYPSTSAFP
ncbi:hypothetical protein C8Q76DRAFT_754907 [Earliella scabrosa]|nr:hypothetical protein C8Q76DRAFT_754907 [Earliella scabrosa]